MIIATVLLTIYLGIALLYWVHHLYGVIRLRYSVPSLAHIEPPEPRRWPKLSVIIPACNEADKIGDALRSVLDSNYPNLEVIVVEDRSTDGTGEIIEHIAAADSQVRVIHMKELPEGWLGKLHAMNRGVQEADGEFLLFTDADVHYQPAALRKAIAHCEGNHLDHLTALPYFWAATLFLDALIMAFIRQFVAMMRPWAVSNPRSRAFLGVGAFNLVRRSAFERTKGLEWLRLEVADDVGLGMMMKQSGAQCGVVRAIDAIGLHWHRSMAEAVAGSEKGYAPICRFSILRTFVLSVVMLGLELSPALCLLPLIFSRTGWIAWLGASVTGVFVLVNVLVSRWFSQKLLPGLIGPVGALISVWLLIRCLVLGKRRGGIVWRGTLYPEKILREHMRVRFP